MLPMMKTQHAEQGSALVEFTLLLGVLLPLGFGMSMLGKLIDLQQTTEQAGRYSTWEATVYSRAKLGAQPPSVLDARFFAAPDAPILSTAVNNAQAGKQTHSENPLWGNSAAHAAGLRELASVSRMPARLASSRYTFDTGKAKAALVTGEIAAAAGRPLSGFAGNSWGIVADGLLRSTVEVAIKPTGFLRGAAGACGTASSATHTPASTAAQDENNEAVCVHSAGVILADGWAASGDAQAVSRVRSLVPASTMQKVGEGVGALLGSVVFPELDSLDKAFGHVDMGVLPVYAK